MSSLLSFIIIEIIISTLIILLLVFYRKSMRVFPPNQYVIHFRAGRIIQAGYGLRLVELPLFDEILVIPTEDTRTSVLIRTDVFYEHSQYQPVVVQVDFTWNICNPPQAFTSVDLNPESPAYVENMMKEVLTSRIKNIIDVTNTSTLPSVVSELKAQIYPNFADMLKKWGLCLKDMEINVLNLDEISAKS